MGVEDSSSGGRTIARRSALLLGGALTVSTASGCGGIGAILGHREARQVRPSECVLPGDIDLEAEEDRLRGRRQELDEQYDRRSRSDPWEPDERLRFTREALAVSPDGTRIMAHEAPDRTYLGLAEEYGTITWDTASGEVLSRRRMSEGEIAWHPTEELLAVAGAVAVDLTEPDGTPTTHLVGHWIGQDWHGRLISHVRYSPDGTQLATCGLDRTVRLWSTQAHTCSPGDMLKGLDLDYLCYSPTGTHLVTGSNEGPIRRYDTGTLKLLDTFAEDASYRYEPVHEPDGTLLAGLDDYQVLVVAPDGSQSTSKGPDGYDMGSLAVAADNRIALRSNPRDMVALWDRHDGTVEDLPGGLEETERLAWAPDGSVLYALSLTEGIKAWDGQSWRSFDLPS